MLGYVGAAATKSIILGLIILATARCSCRCTSSIRSGWSPFLVLTAVTFSLFGFIIGIWADGFEKLQLVPLLIVTPLTFLGGSFYSIDMLPPFWQTVTLFNPVVYLVSGFRWSFYGAADVGVGVSLAMTLVFLLRLPGDRGLDLQDRLPAEGLSLTRCFAAIPNGKPAFTFAGIALWRPRIRALIISGRFRFGRRPPAEEHSLSMARIVMKFGGTSVADIDRIRNVARHVKREVDAGHEVAVVVSAMAGKTNELVAW